MLRLAPDRPVAAPDLPGFGASDKPDHALTVPELADALGAWLDGEGYESAVLIGCSFGTQIVAELAARRPDPVAATVLLAPVMDPDARSIPKALLRWSMELPHEVHQMPITVRDFARGGLPRAVETFRMMLDFPIEERVRQMPMPTLVLRGERDRIVGEDWARRVADLLPDGRYGVLPGARHAANYSSPDEFAAAVRRFLDAVTPPAPDHQARPSPGGPIR